MTLRRISIVLKADILALAICLIALGTTAVIARDILEGIPHVQDSVAYLFQAKIFALGRFYAPLPLFPQFFRHEFILQEGGKWFSKYPPGWPLVLAIGVIVGLPWVVNPLLAAFTLFLIYLLGKEFYSPRIGLLAAFLGLSSPFFLFLSASFMSHPAALFFLTLFILTLIRGIRKGSQLYFLVSGLSWGMAFITRELTALAITFPFTLYALLDLVRRRSLRQYLPLVWGALIPLSFYLLYNAILMGDPLLRPFSVHRPWDRLGFGPGIGNLGRFTPADGLENVKDNLRVLRSHLFGWPPVFTLAFIPVPFLLGSRRLGDYLLLGGFLSLVLAYFFYWAHGIMFGPRYYYEALPMLLLLTAGGIESLVQLCQLIIPKMWVRLPLPSRWASTVAALPVAALLTALLFSNLIVYLPVQLQVYHGYNFTSAKSLQVVARSGVKHAIVFIESNPEWQWWKYGAVFPANSPLLDTDIIYARDLGGLNQALMTLYPERCYYLLKGTHLTKIQPESDSEEEEFWRGGRSRKGVAE